MQWCLLPSKHAEDWCQRLYSYICLPSTLAGVAERSTRVQHTYYMGVATFSSREVSVPSPAKKNSICATFLPHTIPIKLQWFKFCLQYSSSRHSRPCQKKKQQQIYQLMINCHIRYCMQISGILKGQGLACKQCQQNRSIVQSSKNSNAFQPIQEVQHSGSKETLQRIKKL